MVHHLSEMTGREILAAYAEKSEQPGSALWYISFGLRMLWGRIPQLGRAPKQCFVIRRGYDELILGKNVLVLDDVATTGGSVGEVVKTVQLHGGIVAGVGVLWNRGDVTSADFGNVPKFVSVVNRGFGTFTPEGCARIGPCSRGVPINTNLGKGRI
jgi:hypothetical protein